MTATARIHFYSGVLPLPVSNRNQKADDSVFVLEEPYLSGDTLSSASPTADSSTAAPASTRIARLQVEDGKQLYYEVNPPNRSTTATSASPIASGEVILNCGEDWTVSVLEVA